MFKKKEKPGQLNGVKGRLALTAVGVFIVLAGIGRSRMGEQVVRHWTGQPFYSAGLIAVGAFVILLAFVPFSWIRKAAEIHPSNDKRHHSQ
jgi:hypothetical protein